METWKQTWWYYEKVHITNVGWRQNSEGARALISRMSMTCLEEDGVFCDYFTYLPIAVFCLPRTGNNIVQVLHAMILATLRQPWTELQQDRVRLDNGKTALKVYFSLYCKGFVSTFVFKNKDFCAQCFVNFKSIIRGHQYLSHHIPMNHNHIKLPKLQISQ